MKTLRHLFTALLLLCATASSAYDFFAEEAVCCNIISETDQTVELTYGSRGIPHGVEDSYYYDNYFIDYDKIPATVTHDDKTYRVTRIGDYTFSYCVDMLSFRFPVSVTSIGAYAFSQCYNLSTLYIPRNLTSIEEYAFKNCEAFKSFRFPDSLKTIGDGAFSGCKNLVAIGIPESVTSIGDNAFYGCPIATVAINSIEAWCNIDFESSDAPPFLFGGHLYLNGELVTELTIPNTVTAIKDYAFSYCGSLTSVTIPESVTSIGDKAFYGSNLTSVTCKALEPPVVSGSAFYDETIDTLYVPAASLEAYRSSDGWGGFDAYIALPDPSHTITYRVDGEFFKRESLLPGNPITLPEAPTKEGYVFSGWNWAKKEVYGTAPINLAANADAMLHTNAKCTNTTYGDEFKGWHVLFDGNANTFFHSEYSNINSEDGQDHYLRVDMGEGKSVSEFTFTFTTRGNIPTNGNYSPKTMVVEGCNTADGEYAEIATLTNLPSTAAAVYESAVLGNGNAYRYIRFRVTETFQNAKVQGHPYFFMAEFGMTECDVRIEEVEVPETMPDEDIVISGSFVMKDIASHLTNETLYHVSLPYHSKGLASWAVAEGGTEMKSHADIGLTPDAYDAKQQFAFISNNGGATHYLYHAAEKKFVGKKGVLTVEPVDAIRFKVGAYDNTFIAYFDDDNYINVNGSMQMTINGWSTADGGNSCLIVPVGDFDPTEALKAFPIEVTGITLSQSSATLIESESIALTATVAPDDATDKTVTWSTSDERIASVDANGVVTAVAAGRATITATSGGHSAVCLITVEKGIAVSGITLSQSSVFLTEDEYITLTATVAPDDATNKTVIWSSSNERIASVNANGVVSAHNVGTVTITANAGGKKAVCVVTVTPTAYITSTDELKNHLLFHVVLPYHSKGLASWAVAEGGTEMKSNADLGLTPENNDRKQRFAFISNDGGATRYLYHAAEKKFVGKKGVLTSQPVDAIHFKAGAYDNTFFAYFDENNYINVGGSQQMTIDGWSAADGGNSCVFAVVPVVFDPTEALAAFAGKVSSISLSQTTASLVEGEVLTLTATISPEDATDKTVTWSTSDEGIASVDANGVVTAVAAGTATITATAGGHSATCVITVEKKEIAVSGITLHPNSVNLTEGEAILLTATVTPEDATDKTVTWSTSDERIATVDANGVVTAVAAGTAAITATAGDKEAVCVVTVEGAAVEPEPEHTITYRVDGEIVKSESLLPGTPINHPETPTKQGYIFSGWRWSQKVFNFTENDNVLYTNAKCTNTSYGDEFKGWHVLFDGNANTFFHSEYSNVDSEDGEDHYLRVDMGLSAKEFSFTYTVRGTIPNNGNYSPKTMVVEGSKTADGEYTEIATLTNLPRSAAAVYESGILSNGNAYRYIRFRVTETFQNAKVQGHPYFFMAEFGMTKYHEGAEASTIPSTMPTEDIVISGWFVKNGITSLDQLNNETLYSISLPRHAKCPASWAVAENGTAMKSNADLMLPFDANDAKQQFAFISNDGGATRYLYHAAEKKFVGKKGVLTEEPVDAILFKAGAYDNTFFAYFDENNYINVGGSQEMTIDWWSTADGGNSVVISPVGNFNPTEALSKFGGTGIEKSAIRNEKSAIIYDLQGRRVEKPTKGMYIVGGKIVVIK